jgi:hypothetical protein
MLSECSVQARNHPHDVRRLQPGLEESGLGHDHGLSDSQPLSGAMRAKAVYRAIGTFIGHGRYRSQSNRRARADDACDHTLGGALRFRFAARPTYGYR